VYANDLNPSSAQYLDTNIRINRLAGRVHPFNMDGRQFVRLLLATPGGPADDLPAAASEPEQSPAAAAAAAVATSAGQASSSAAAAASAAPGSSKPIKAKTAAAAPLPAGPPPAIPPGFAPTPGGLIFQHAVMNLPASAVEFLDAFGGAFDPEAWRGRRLPMVHCYTFMRNEGEEGESSWFQIRGLGSTSKWGWS
jgi:tRNA (guanine37-N1)-methyltransferase